MDVLYIVGRDSLHDDIELRWSLRSLAQYAKGIGRVIVAGYPPAWLSDAVVRIPVLDRSDGYKHHNILAAIMAAFEAKDAAGNYLVADEVLYSSDDHFLARPCDLDDYPFYFKAELLPRANDYRREPTAYQKSLIRTRKLLEAAGLEPRNWSGHRNTHLSRRDVPKVKELLALGERLGLGRFGYEPTCLFMAARAAREAVTPVMLPDLKMESQFTLPRILPPLDYRFIDANAAIREFGLSRVSGTTWHGKPATPLQVFRLAAPLLPEFADTAKLLYCDIDVEFRSPKFIEALAYDFPGEVAMMTDNPQFGARRQGLIKTLNPAADTMSYYNSGVMVMNLPKIRANHPHLADDLPRWMDLCVQHRLSCIDQDIINAFFETSPLPQAFNTMPRHYVGGPAHIVHYASGDKLSGVYPPPHLADMVPWPDSPCEVAAPSPVENPAILFCVDSSPQARAWLHHALCTLAKVAPPGLKVYIATDSPYTAAMPPAFSIGDGVFNCPEFLEFMERNYSTPCRYER